MTKRDLEIFAAVAEHCNMSEAGRKLYIAPSFVSQTILDLEEHFHTTLFVRQNRRLYITKEGELLLDYVHHILGLYDDMERAIRPDMKIQLRVGATASVSAYILGGIVEQYKQNTPDVDVEIVTCHTGDIVSKLRRHAIDIGIIVEWEAEYPFLTMKPFFEDDMMLICGRDHPLYGRRTVALEELERQPFVLRERGSRMRAMFESSLSQKSVSVNEIWSGDNVEAIKQAVIQNHALTVMSPFVFLKEYATGAVGFVKIEGFSFHRQFVLAHHKNHMLSLEMQRFIETCQEYRRNLAVQ